MSRRVQVENNQGSRMRISWVVADAVASDPTIDIEKLKNIGSIWGGWKTWRSCGTDNVICHGLSDAQQLVSKNFHTRCNLYLPLANYQSVDRPPGIKIYHGDFHFEIDQPDEIVAMHLAAQNSDIVLLLGFDLKEHSANDADKLTKHKWHVYKHYIRQIIADKSDVQWVLIDQSDQLDKIFKELPNLQLDVLSNILS